MTEERTLFEVTINNFNKTKIILEKEPLDIALALGVTSLTFFTSLAASIFKWMGYTMDRLHYKGQKR